MSKRFFLKEWRKLRGMTQERLAERADTSKGYISDMERGIRPYNQAWLELFANILQIEPVQLLSPPPEDAADEPPAGGRAQGESPAPSGGDDDVIDERLLHECLANALRIIIRRQLHSDDQILRAAEDAASAAASAYESYVKLRNGGRAA